MPIEDLDHGPAAMLRYLYDRRRSGVELRRLLEMGMVTAHEMSGLLTELEGKGLVRIFRQHGVTDAHITADGIAWVRSRYGET